MTQRSLSRQQILSDAGYTRTKAIKAKWTSDVSSSISAVPQIAKIPQTDNGASRANAAGWAGGGTGGGGSGCREAQTFVFLLKAKDDDGDAREKYAAHTETWERMLEYQRGIYAKREAERKRQREEMKRAGGGERGRIHTGRKSGELR